MPEKRRCLKAKVCGRVGECVKQRLRERDAIQCLIDMGLVAFVFMLELVSV